MAWPGRLGPSIVIYLFKAKEVVSKLNYKKSEQDYILRLKTPCYFVHLFVTFAVKNQPRRLLRKHKDRKAQILFNLKAFDIPSFALLNHPCIQTEIVLHGVVPL